MKKKLFISFLFLTIQLPGRGLSCENSPHQYILHDHDKLQFGRLWQQIRRLEEKQLLYPMILQRRKEIAAIKNHWKEKITQLENLEITKALHKNFESGILRRCETGCGSAYFLIKENGEYLYVIKPFDEDILCLNNRKYFASPYNNLAFRVRDHIPLYRSTQTEGFAYRLAQLLDLAHLTPETHLAIFTHDNFFDITDRLSATDPLLSMLGKPDREKLCSVQVFHKGLRTLQSLVEEWLEKDLPEEKIIAAIDKTHFDEMVLLIWLFYDTDTHAGNLYAKKTSNDKVRLLKIDNGLTFPEKNSHLMNALYFFPQALKPLSPNLVKKIRDLPTEKAHELFCLFEMENTYDAFLERVEVLQKLTQNPSMTIREIDIRLHALELPRGKEVALSPLSLEDLHQFIK